MRAARHALLLALPNLPPGFLLTHPVAPPPFLPLSPVANPGYGFNRGGAAIACAEGFYNPGFNTRPCSKCPAGLTTNGGTKTSLQQCVAPEGYYYLGGKAVACAQGTYKTDKANRDCSECATGWTTKFGEVGKTNENACNCELFLLRSCLRVPCQPACLPPAA